MSDESAKADQAADSGKTKKQRSPVERAVVWGGIAILLVLVGMQWWARRGYESSVGSLQRAIRDAEADLDSAEPLRFDQARSLLVGNPSVSEKSRGPDSQALIHTWSGPFKSYSLRLVVDSRDENPAVLLLETEGAPQEEATAENDLVPLSQQQDSPADSE